MHALSPADELAEIRAEIARLKAREAALRAQFLLNPKVHALGRWSRVEVVETRECRFNAALLPEAIRCDPRYHEEKLIRIVRCLPAPLTATVRPGWPIPRASLGYH